MFVLKRIFVFVMAFFFSFQTIFMEHVFAATQRKTTSTARSGSSRTSSAKKNTTAKKATSSRTSRGSKTTARSGSSARKTTTRSSTARSSTRNSGATTSLRSSQTADISTNDATANTRGTACRNAYVECMDIQIEGLLTKYSYLADDDAIIAMQETGDPLRCIYYHDLNTSTTTKTSSSSIKNINDLYYAYNYYCEQETEAGASGQPIIKCNFVGFDNLKYK